MGSIMPATGRWVIEPVVVGYGAFWENARGSFENKDIIISDVCISKEVLVNH